MSDTPPTLADALRSLPVPTPSADVIVPLPVGSKTTAATHITVAATARPSQALPAEPAGAGWVAVGRRVPPTRPREPHETVALRGVVM